MKTKLDISVWAERGGCGKTTLALSLAGAFASRGLEVLLIDHDPARAATLWAELARLSAGNTPFSVATLVREASRAAYDVVLHDHGPGMPSRPLPGQIVVMPALMDAVSIASIDAQLPTLRRQGKKGLVIPNRIRFDRSAVKSMLWENYKEAPIVTDRAIFATAYGRGATCYDEAGLLQAHGARREIDGVRPRLPA
jgi:chromosome partitioning protein